jgi:hypothetical protein
MNRTTNLTFVCTFFIVFSCFGQEELLELLDDQSSDQYVSATFKSTRLVNGHTVEIRSPKVLEFIIGHRFGRANLGSQEFWGLDQATIRLGLEYGLAKNLNIGIGRASFDKVIDTYAKYRIIRQSDKAPVTVTALGTMAYVSLPGLEIEKSQRYDYTGQLLIARKFGTNFSLQLMPTLIQRQLVPTNDDDNLLIALGVGGRYKLSNRVAFNAEYYPQLTDYNDDRYNSFAIGFDIETGGHVFQLHLTNAQQMTEQGFVGETTGDFFGGDIHFGFNISRVFDLGAGKKKSAD